MNKEVQAIRAEVERRKKICEGVFERESDTYYQGKAVAYGELLSFIDSQPEEKPAEDLEEAANEYANQDCVAFISRKRGFIAGAEWMRKQMMKKAVDAQVVKDTHGFFHIKSDCVDGAKYKFGEWVKIIILKDDENNNE